jgi:hypothetical protein
MKKEVKKDMNIFTEIANITTNNELNAVIDAINAQATIVRSIESAKAKAFLSVGDTVILNGKKTKGLEGVITKMKIKRAIVMVDGVSWDCPFSMLEVVS